MHIIESVELREHLCCIGEGGPYNHAIGMYTACRDGNEGCTCMQVIQCHMRIQPRGQTFTHTIAVYMTTINQFVGSILLVQVYMKMKGVSRDGGTNTNKSSIRQ